MVFFLISFGYLQYVTHRSCNMSSTLKTPQSHTTTGWEFLLIFFFKPNFAENFSSCHCFFLSRRRLDIISDITLRS